MSNSRYREKPNYGTLIYNGAISDYLNPRETILETPVTPRFNDLVHYKAKGTSGKIWSGDHDSFYQNCCLGRSSFLEVYGLAKAHDNYHVAIPWRRLPTSSEFNSIVFLAELKETIATFGFKMARSLIKRPTGAYGLYTWGLRPIVADLEAILAMIMAYDSLSNATDFHAVDDHTFSIQNKQIDRLYTTFEGDLKVTFAGKIYSGSGLPVLADYIGFHPDLVTLYDLVPLSFLVDYFLPIGDYLDSVMRSGWVDTTYFEGSLSEKAVIRKANRSGRSDVQTFFSATYYNRSFARTNMSVQRKTKPPQFELPNFHQLFNAAYILALPGIERKVSKEVKKRRRRRPRRR